jgi:DNA-binding PadR family transcriptional regulator
VLTRLIVLGMLAIRPMSGYEIQRFLQLSRTDQWAGVLPGSIYHALKKLAEEGLVRLEATEHLGNRARALYAITPAGQIAYRALLQSAWATPSPHFPTGIYVALMFAGDLPTDVILAALNQHIAALEEQIATWTEGEAIKTELAPEPMRSLQRAIFANGRDHFEIDLRFLRDLRAMLQTTPPITVPIPPLEEEPS